MPLNHALEGLCLDAAMTATKHLTGKQNKQGWWEGEVVWCPMILAQYIIVQRLLGRSLTAHQREGMIRHFAATRTRDGGWGLHPESPACVYTTALGYVALRLLGLPPEEPLVAPARTWLRSSPGGLLAIPTWGKFWLSMIGLYDYRGMNPIQPELCLPPGWLPVHPERLYCHTRYIYLAMAYLYGSRFSSNLGPVTAELRRELYAQEYEHIDFAAHRFHVAETDLFAPPHSLLRMLQRAMHAYERVHSVRWRRRALAYCFDRILFEQRSSRYHAISPVNGLLNCLAIFARNPRHADLASSIEGLENWKWEDDAEGIRYAGARSRTWDTAFAMQALLQDSAAARDAVGELRAAYRFLGCEQITEELECPCHERRDPVRGGWCFGDRQHRWPVSDCTAEALTSVLQAHETPGLIRAEERISDSRLALAAEFILGRQNADGGFSTYERRRGLRLLEMMNPSEMFGNCMTELSYVECTGSCLRALAHFREAFPRFQRRLIDRAIQRGVGFLLRHQNEDGSYTGSWGVCFTYAIFFAIEGLCSAGLLPDHPALVRASQWLVCRQREDGGWGEHYRSCATSHYEEHSQSQPVMTSWSLLALMRLHGVEHPAVKRAISWLQANMQPDGSWRQEQVTGAFFGSAMLDYRLYKSYFPAWACSRYAALVRRRGAGAAAL